MKSIKKVTLIVAAFSFLFVVGCGSKGSSTTDTTEEAAMEETATEEAAMEEAAMEEAVMEEEAPEMDSTVVQAEADTTATAAE